MSERAAIGRPSRRWFSPVTLALVGGLATGSAAWAAAGVGGGRDVEHVFGVSAVGEAAGLTFDRHNLLPVTPLVDFGLARATATVDAAPAASGRAAPFSPGVVGAANAAGPALLGLPAGVIPAYPLYADAAYPTGPERGEVGTGQADPRTGTEPFAAVSGKAGTGEGQAEARVELARMAAGTVAAPGRTARLVAGPQGRQLIQRVHSAVLGALRDHGIGGPATQAEPDAMVEFRLAGAQAEAREQGGDLFGSATSRLVDVTLLGGLLSMESISTRLSVRWPASAAEPVLDAGTEITGARLFGMPVRITRDGVEFGAARLPGTFAEEITKAIGAAFAGQGMSFSVGSVVTGTDRGLVTGLQVDFDGEIQPGETDRFHLKLGRSELAFASTFSVLDSGASGFGDPGADLVSAEQPAAGQGPRRDGPFGAEPARADRLGTLGTDEPTGEGLAFGTSGPDESAPSGAGRARSSAAGLGSGSDGWGASADAVGASGRAETSAERPVLRLGTSNALSDPDGFGQQATGRLTWVAALFGLGAFASLGAVGAGRFGLYAPGRWER